MVASTEVKILSDTSTGLRIGGYGVVFGGQDIVGDYFSPETDFWPDESNKTPPVLYQHGQDPGLKRARVGRVEAVKADDIGLWVEAQLSTSSKYLDAIRELVKKGVLGWSSGAVGYLVDRLPGRAGRKMITSWPIYEFSLTPTPAEPRTIGVRAIKSLGIDFAVDDYEIEDDTKAIDGESIEAKPYKIEKRGAQFCVVGPDGKSHGCHDSRAEALAQQRALYANEPSASKAPMSTDRRNSLSGRDFAYIDSDGGRHLPVNDESHVRNAISRFGQTHFESPEKRKAAARKIRARASALGIELADDSAVAQAAKGGPPLNDLPDDAFAYVEAGGTKENGLTTPRAHRHFPHHDEDGVLDEALLEVALADATKSDLGEHARAHLLRHARAAVTKSIDDAHSKFWSENSAAGQLLAIFSEGISLTDAIVVDQKSMEHLGYGLTELRIRPEPLQRLKELKAFMETVIDHAAQAEQGDDGTVRANYLRQRLALMEV